MDEKLKERVVGAAVLVVAAIIVVPMILSGPEPSDQDSVTTPEAPSQRPTEEDLSSRIVPLKSDQALALTADGNTTSSGPGSEPKPARADSKPAPDKPQRKSEPSSAKPAPAAKPTPPKKPAAGWVVQLGSFSNKGNALGLKERLIKRGYSAFVETSTASGAEITRVYVGPEKSRDKAKARLPGLYQETKLKGIVTRYDG